MAIYRKFSDNMDKTFRYFNVRPSFKNSTKLYNILKSIKNNGIGAIDITDVDYPWLLKNIITAPPILFIKGRPLLQNLKIAVVGTRKASSYGLKAAAYWGARLSKAGLTVVSGLAHGIDSSAQEAALNHKGGSIGVLGCGIGYVYPIQNNYLFKRIVQNGTLISEYLPYSTPKKINFIQRNRIISGLCGGTLVVESAERGGSLITANFALEQGREVFAVPGSIFSPVSQGTHNLIQNGAKLVYRLEHVLDELIEAGNKLS